MGFIIIAIHSRVRGNKERGARISKLFQKVYINNYYTDIKSLYFCWPYRRIILNRLRPFSLNSDDHQCFNQASVLLIINYVVSLLERNPLKRLVGRRLGVVLEKPNVLVITMECLCWH